ncbi:DUF1080 domain-containing protein [Roseisolibacter sp. H3M3-2]|uniref:3-keto-disaccharide hydrolase n=1 Tax=Roseisolibacter sp. H3M3-2 TaxID=3031323 RepID=UPI0023DA9205|nr:DUF1080 domain-containing protein [Roseisolibacter sp. H3M3-2]MDF1502966.1 DUF1080 domain-containing protein [Roseisolibacter sp. H3M3-2]
MARLLRPVVLLALLAAPASAQQPAAPRPEDTEVWQPVPRVVDAGPGPKAPLPRPADAIALFDGRSLAEWTNAEGGPAGWKVVDGTMVVHKPAGDVKTRRRFTNYQLHLEYRVPPGMKETGQSRGNSGLFLAVTGGPGGGYELQILDSYRNTTYVNGQAGSIYKQNPPLVNASRAPGEWQTYDVIWTAPTFGPDGAVKTPAVVTALHNGVLVQDRYALTGETLYTGTPRYVAHGASPILLQAHGDPSPPLSFRNIWVRELP